MGTPERSANRPKRANANVNALVFYKKQPMQVSLNQLQKIRNAEKTLRISRNKAIELVIMRYV